MVAGVAGGDRCEDEPRRIREIAKSRNERGPAEGALNRTAANSPRNHEKAKGTGAHSGVRLAGAIGRICCGLPSPRASEPSCTPTTKHSAEPARGTDPARTRSLPRFPAPIRGFAIRRRPAAPAPAPARQDESIHRQGFRRIRVFVCRFQAAYAMNPAQRCLATPRSSPAHVPRRPHAGA